jgi:RNA polymerase sigma-70 factor (ECF subfamily)
MIINETNFIRELKNKNEDALLFVIDKYGGLIKSIINKTLYHYPDDAEECLCDVFLKIWQNIDCFDESKNTFKNWVAAVAKYRAIDKLRTLKKSEIYVDIDDFDIADTNALINDKELRENFNELISCLNEQDREIFIRLYLVGESIEEIAEKIGKSKDVVYNRISRGKKKIKKQINSEGVI